MFNEPSCTRIAPRKSQESKVSSNPSQRHYRISTTIIKNFLTSLEQRRITDPGIKSLLRSRKWFYTPVSQSLPISPSSPSTPSFPESLQPMLTDVQPHVQDLITFDFPDIIKTSISSNLSMNLCPGTLKTSRYRMKGLNHSQLYPWAPHKNWMSLATQILGTLTQPITLKIVNCLI